MASIQQYYSIASAHNGKWLASGEFVYLSTESGVSQIWKANPKTGETQQLTFFQERVMKLYVTPAGDQVLFAMDKGGNEQEQLHVLDLSTGKSRPLTDNDKARHQLGGVLPDGKTVVFSCNGRNSANFDICALNMDEGAVRILYQNSDNYNMPAALSGDGRYFLYNKLKGQSDNCLWMLDLQTLRAEKIDPEGSFAQYVSPVFTPDSKGIYLLTDKDSEFVYLAYYDIASKTLKKVYEEGWDLESLALSRDGKYLAMLVNRDGYSELEVMNTATGAFLNIPRPPKGVSGYYGMSWSYAGYQLLLSVTSGSRPADVWLVDLEADCAAKLTHTSLQGIEADELVEPALCHYASYDGLTVPYWYYKAPGADGSAPGPVVIDIHGGPEGQERPTFDALKEYLVAQGFSIVAPNVRGSVGYGKSYHHLDDVEKRMDSVRDIDNLVKHLVACGQADPQRIAVMGGSYGGFMTLASITEYPDLWAAAIDIVGISNFETFLTNTAEYRRAHRESEYGSLAHHRDILRQVSPIHKVDRIVAPLMVIHGANDPRVPVGEAEQIVESLRSRNVPVEYLCYEDEGHGLSKRKNQLDCYPQVVAFLKKYLSAGKGSGGMTNG